MSKRAKPQRCNARLRQKDTGLHRAAREGRLTEYLRRSGYCCRNWPVRGKKRCRFHGGLSTGPMTPDGMARTLAAMKAGRTRWLAKLKSEGKPIPCGRKKGGRNLWRKSASRLPTRNNVIVKLGRYLGKSGPNEKRAAFGSARTPVAGWRSTLGGRLVRMLVCRIGPMNNGRTF